MNRFKNRFFWVVLILFVVLNFVHCVEDEFRETGNPALAPVVAEMIYNRLSNLSTVFGDAIFETSDFCIKSVKQDWNGAFNFDGRLDFITNCIKKSRDITHRLCTAAEINFYFGGHFTPGAKARTRHLEPNKNCNTSSWPSGCEPGWCCAVKHQKKVELENLKDIPVRTDACKPCCEVSSAHQVSLA